MRPFGHRDDLWRDEPKKENEINISDSELYDELSQTNKYYDSVSKLYSAARYLLLIILALFVTLSTIKNSDSITYGNLMFLFKDFGSVIDSASSGFSAINYDPDSTISCEGFRNDLVVLSSSGIKIYSGDGDKIFEGTDRFAEPKISVSDRYILMYDFCGNEYALYNSFARIYTEKLDYEITNADISESGMYAVVTRTKEYNSAVLLYTKNCALKNRYKTNDRVIDLSINKSGTRLCVLSFFAENASFSTKIVILNPGSDSAVAELTLVDTFPLECNYTDDGRLTVFCSNSIYFYDENGNLEAAFPLSSVPDVADLSSNGCAVAMSENAVTTGGHITVLDTKGNILYGDSFSGKITEMRLCDGYLFILSGNELVRINIKNGETDKKTTNGGKSMIVYSTSDVMVCSQSRAEYYNFNENEDED